jgi:hypothetical protein
MDEDNILLDDLEFMKQADDRLYELPKWIVEKSVKVLQETLDVETVQTIKKLWKINPVNWFAGSHFSWGMAIRNLLRDKVCLDDKLNENEKYQNWDNYYVQLVEIAIGVRIYE